jgi:DNA segregation ATPase FtsK/SpoIIIE-like protein
MTLATSNALTTGGRHLPAELPRHVERVGYQILAALDRLGFTHQNNDGSVFSVRFCDVAIYDRRWAAYEIDVQRLWHFSIPELAHSKVVATLSAATRLPIRTLSQRGFFYVADLCPQRKSRLPARLILDLDRRPKGELLVPIGRGRDGEVWRSLPQLGHLLLAGATGAGKSSFIHAALAVLLTDSTPEQLRVVLLDPKRAELSPWAQAPHVISAPNGGAAHTPKQAEAVLGSIVAEIDRRGDLLASLGARDVAAYKTLLRNRAALGHAGARAATALPHILVVIDEALDLTLMAGSSSQLATYLKIIATRGRSAGVILWCATQHASAVSGLPRVVNVNLVSRVVFRVNDRSAAQTAGCPGAEQIDRRKPGRLLAKIDGPPVELQGYYLPDERLRRLARGLSA